MKKIYFVRHGETDWNKKKILQGKLNSSLTDFGIEQTQKLSQKIATLNIQIIISSPLERAIQTSKILSNGIIPIVTDNLIEEMGFGELEGKTKEYFSKTYPKEYRNLWNNATQYDPSEFNGETFEELYGRAKQFLIKLKNIDNDKILVVSHGMMLKMIYLIIRNHSLSEFWQEPVQANTSITTVSLHNNNFSIEEFSNTDHLS